MKGVGCRLKITQDSTICGPKTRVWLDGQEITHGVQRIALDLMAGELTTAHLTVIVDALEIDAATMAEIAAKLVPGVAVTEVSS